MAEQFYLSDSDPQIDKDMVLAEPKLYVSKQKFSGSGVASISTDDVTLTPATSPAWTVDEHKSLAGVNIVVKANNGEVFEGPVKTNTATAVTFDATEMVSRLDGTAGAPTDFTATNSYFFYILEPHDEFAWGGYFGFAKELELTAEEETADFEFGTPAEQIRSDLIKKKLSIKGKNFNPANEAIFQAIFNSVQAGAQTGQWEQHLGFAPGARPYYRVTCIGKTVENLDQMIQVYLGQFKQEGGYAMSGNEHKGIGFSLMAKRESLSAGDRSIGRVRTDK